MIKKAFTIFAIISMVAIVATACFEESKDALTDSEVNQKAIAAMDAAYQSAMKSSKRASYLEGDYTITCPNDTCSIKLTYSLKSSPATINYSVTFTDFSHDGITLNGSAKFESTVTYSQTSVTTTMDYVTSDDGLTITADGEKYTLLWDISITGTAQSEGGSWSFEGSFDGTYTVNGVTASYSGSGYAYNQPSVN